ncbi:YcjF family protein [Flavilitoribacter nigricans]|uniref:GTPase n=1 Tax=Flavilitoribacter nigricans (strain ATCC 23147 / DSM 23189 / NBRC 102662 / NCIMB 1420 / SS-2) TaxID=1122177 RepID=A0A2D0NAN7_FLAN2|nr:DUF697 domain-containing protein [Flavilitoribacter nigricans]PHN05582.1 GTPase [Flavilitoribacter nigricans DSM 23189 = NBRC 102662]
MPAEEKKTLETADDIIYNHLWFSAVPGFMPVPLLDIVAISAVQLDLVKQLCKFYHEDYDEQRGKAIVMALTGSAMSRITGYSARAVLKTIPMVGWVLGGAAMSLFAVSSTYAIGQVFKEHLDAGGTLHNLNPEAFRQFYTQQLEKGKGLVSKWLKKD